MKYFLAILFSTINYIVAIAVNNQYYPGEDYSLCSKLDCSTHASCFDCSFFPCKYGKVINVTCTTRNVCSRKFSVIREAFCKYCWQLDMNFYDCAPVRNCSTSAVKPVRTICRVHQNVVCMGHRVFFKNIRCNWSSGYSWWKTMLLSVTLGGFGVDRFYLGMWKSAIGKLFSFGGLGIWTIVDAILIGVGYIGPADGSLYV